ncbi:MAG: hypothetical protein ACOCXA_09025, partial [Planctomycetota bacterium]
IDNAGVECRQVIAEYHKVVQQGQASEAAVEKLKQDMYQDWEEAKVVASRAVYAHVTVRIGPTYYNTVMEQLTESTFQV